MENLPNILKNEPAFRKKQIYKAWFDLNINRYEKISTLSLALREKLKNIPWLTVKLKTLQTSKTEHTSKALLELTDGEVIETVLMGRDNKKEDKPAELRYTICVSTQVGCPMNCAFCATGKMGFKRNLTTEEIVDQYRYWQKWLGKKGKIDNIVLMGQGEPLLNYDNVKNALNILLDNTDIGPRKITLSTAGVPSAMEKMIEDKEFPTVRFALSLHSATENTRTKLMPSHQKDFLKFLIE
ncbi:MAG: putative dual-specificity RNA methyltransferase RlmN [Candidatus Magasanikbacteria bacterium GW2011_GWA2_37_8]|uniref:Putative dual-specificity RNA methyltransferase RlmN n=1 Tax=Candidatus Magasanikbacteria bacterium GW2011_GWA2_37_8 TaxID=1619036 RepID=A0A0G0JRA6_9BACT|nr:MAG: putative dual-specificity RNA methyltransferase RlmN [Candidatus Magasanikbacteria bacterium GW2011_GWA2_37_8]